MISYMSDFPTAYASGYPITAAPASYTGVSVYPGEITNQTGSEGMAPMPASAIKSTSGIYFTGNVYYRE